MNESLTDVYSISSSPPPDQPLPPFPLCNRVAVNQLCSVVVSDAVSHTPQPHILPAATPPRRPASAPDMRQLERHQLQQDMLRIELE